ncbi:fumarylacetoacetate hydrolase family protein [Neomoorella carbonis]|uniref:fumarylacetoacetate hydrolase family protein n=1 Tax=Neomoorella carbonis TaxID=3062783 RepID=UPI0032549628
MGTFLRFKVSEDQIYQGILEDDRVFPIEGDIYTRWTIGKQGLPLDAIKILAPCVPSKVICVGTNYRSVLAAKGQAVPPEPVIFLKPPSAIIGPGEEIIYPGGVEKLGYEVELAVVIKDKVKAIRAEEALNHVLGTIANDITAKDFMTGGPWTKAKSYDTFLPLGPWIVSGLDPDNLHIMMRVNGKITQDASTSDMVFKVTDIIAYVSNIMTLMPGDVIITGTPPGAGLLQPDDIIEASIEGIGTLTNKVILQKQEI